MQGTGIAAARALIADALDLRYRLPRLWDRVLTGGVRAWQARKIAEQTRPLSWEACADVDRALSDVCGDDAVAQVRQNLVHCESWTPTRRWLRNALSGPGPAAQDVFSFDAEDQDGLKTPGGQGCCR